jgi:hypothetical protein
MDKVRVNKQFTLLLRSITELAVGLSQGSNKALF